MTTGCIEASSAALAECPGSSPGNRLGCWPLASGRYYRVLAPPPSHLATGSLGLEGLSASLSPSAGRQCGLVTGLRDARPPTHPTTRGATLIRTGQLASVLAAGVQTTRGWAPPLCLTQLCAHTRACTTHPHTSPPHHNPPTFTAPSTESAHGLIGRDERRARQACLGGVRKLIKSNQCLARQLVAWLGRSANQRRRHSLSIFDWCACRRQTVRP
ncbi:unnamed protein product [Protopolystoma xenopodis]|uniref:Uncharacterized protein n=1 Tax=Protopolystoma xenopodis TaxID=117903 RepID=A0A448WUZ2_9PLAT|nr:unnamed protein product [Protopolystoma xenopodis]